MIKVIDGTAEAEGRKVVPGRSLPSAVFDPELGRRAFLGLLTDLVVSVLRADHSDVRAANLPQAAFLAPTPQMFRQFLDQQGTFVFFITVYAGAGLIANDRRANALQIYSVEADHTRRVCVRQAGSADGVPVAR